jgi:nicotinate-nucleotide adenylyltransferase
MRVGLLGGSFNPAHTGHVHISLQAKKYLNLNQIWWIPTKQNPFKNNSNNFKERLDKCQEITKQYPHIFVKNSEEKINNIYSIDLIKKLQKTHPNHQFFWIMGADNLIKFHLWKNWQEIIKLTPLIICDRGNYFYQAIKSRGFLFAKKLNKYHFLKIRKIDISSTQIRKQNEL